jgi:predicted nuclease with TOPRIM domain
MSMATNESIYKQHEENTEWLKKLDFYKDEITILKNRLEELADKNNAKDVLAEVEHFQNQFIIQRNNIDEIAHKVRENEQALQDEIKSNPVAVDHRKMEYHATEKDLVNSFEKVFNEIREDFNKFSAKWM